MHKIYDPEFYKVVFFSSAPIGVPFLEKLDSDPRFEVTGVVTMPDAPAGRGMKMQENVIKTKAKEFYAQNSSLRGSDTTNQSSSLGTKEYHFILLHGLTGRPEKNFLPQLQKELEKQ
jgi:methionyl-tRNA formyltransferase